jgi:hypothetical protein
MSEASARAEAKRREASVASVEESAALRPAGRRRRTRLTSRSERKAIRQNCGSERQSRASAVEDDAIDA